MKAKKIDHICIAVRDLKNAQEIYEDTLGLELTLKYEAEKEKIRVKKQTERNFVNFFIHPPFKTLYLPFFFKYEKIV